MLKDGYYISAYVHVDGLSNAANWWNRHDQNISLWKLDGDDVTLVEYWELERFTGQKQHFTAFSSIKD
ncbi:hypothetical protein [Pectobacterium sp. B2J-2]|uniref:hypothetical protein n=1 Tax=Pectobacterium sp. B2J-2 TaxID=3385372 RepID=UPI0038FBF0FB